MLIKKDYAGGSSMTIYEHDRNGAIWRKIKCFNIFPSTPPTGLNEDNYDSVGDAKTVSITFIVDDWIEQTVGLEEYRNEQGIDDNKYESYGVSELGNVYNTNNRQ
jgi:hypothetical protein